MDARNREGSVEFGNKMESLLSKRCGFSPPKLAACDSIFVAIEQVVTSPWNIGLPRCWGCPYKQWIPIPLCWTLRRSLGGPFSKMFSQNRVSWDWNAVVRKQFCLFQLQLLTTLPWLPPARFCHLSFLSISTDLSQIS